GYEPYWYELDYHENSVVFNALPPGKYTFIVHAINGETVGDPIEYSFEINSPYYQKWWFYTLMIISSGLIVFVIAYYRIRRIRYKNKERLEKQRIQTDLLDSELKALRSQMNPHFIFNSLNSIQDLILKEETDASYDYIVLFANLVRSTLNYSNKAFIQVEKELEFLEVYLSLEKLRFKEDFKYEIIYNGSKDIEVPSLIVQPFIENALQHGLLHRRGLKKLRIEFELTDQLICTITDNGVGRVRAKEIQIRQGSEHESFALEAIKKRLSILSEQHNREVGYVVTDLYENGEAKGTKVEIAMPYSQRF
ncbi:MAG: histidine kinase, partial [Flavobacteriales bacterium]|nr:histidine kinase [Flavobacteriales bacterium]